MEVVKMDEVVNKAEPTSAAAFVEGGVQEACDDSCSICLEDFSDSNPSTVTSCKHEFHLQCMLEWCQRSSNCPMCWQTLKLKDPTSQELLDAVERERSLRSVPPPRSTRIFHHSTLGDFELQHLPAGMDDAELEERIMRHLAAMSGAHRIARSSGPRSRSGHARSQFVVYSTGAGGEEETPETGSMTENNTFVHGNRIFGSSSRDNRDNATTRPSLPNRDGAGPSEFHSFSDTWRSRFSSISSKYKESISKSTKELKEKLFSRSPSMAEIGSEVRREVSATVSRVMERLESGGGGAHTTARANGPQSSSAASRGRMDDAGVDVAPNGNGLSTLPANSVSS
ncbi:E3 ubiquitin-protein ligase RHF2A [Striga hermonthica]|uniref:RING-type E3 ubiquitin transferase n=1 Tax=Striga hermonthica TaxID=68872 RepID=A0A9N7RBE2_STRHE|nr:E3 ubiquitin-protein ligase RHF2A [Striga hermonthica]